MKRRRTTLDRWRADPAAFIEHCLIDPETSKPFVLLDAEREFLKHAFKLDESGRLLYPEQVYACPKKSGKTTFAAIYTISLVMLFGGTFPEAIVCANDYEQSVGRVHQAIRRIVECSPMLAASAKITADKVMLADAAILAIPSDYASAAGSNQNIAVFDELWAFASERARRLFDELVPVPSRKVSARLTVTYAGFGGESVLLEELYKRGLAQPPIGLNLYAGDGLLMFWSHDPVAPWQTENWLAEMRRSLRQNQYLRMIENRFVTSESSFIDLEAWDQCCDPGVRPVIEDKALPVWIGVDASTKSDTTAIVACTYADQRVRLVAHRIFVPTKYDPINCEQAIEATLADMAQRYAVRRILFDPYQMVATSQRLVKRGLPIIEFPQTVPNLTLASQNLYELISGRNLIAYPDAPMRLAISRAVAVETSRGWRIAKEKASHKIDVVVALAMAAYAATKSASEFTEPPTVIPYIYSKTSGVISDPSSMRPAAPPSLSTPASPSPSTPPPQTSNQPPLLHKDAPIPAHYLRNGGEVWRPYAGTIENGGAIRQPGGLSGRRWSNRNW
jgi:hypothetical protein